MKVSDVFTELVHGELSAHAVAMTGGISDTDAPKVISYINSGLLSFRILFSNLCPLTCLE